MNTCQEEEETVEEAGATKLLIASASADKYKSNIIQPAREESERASRARAVTVSQCPHSEVRQDFLLRRRVTPTETAVTRKRKV